MYRCRQILWTLLLWSSALRVSGQDLGLQFSASPTPAVVGRPVTYSLSVTNQTGSLLTNFVVQVELRGPVVLTSSSTTVGTATNVAFFASYSIPLFTSSAQATLTYAGLPTDYGVVTHLIVAGPAGFIGQVATYTSTNISGTAQLDLKFGSLPGGVVVNDHVTYRLSVTNRGPDAAAGVIITNTFPEGVKFLQVNPPGTFGSLVGQHLRLNLGSLASAEGTLLEIAVQPTNAGTFILRAHAEAPGYVNPDPARSKGEASLTATTSTVANLRTAVLSDQVFNPQTGLLEQHIGLINEGSNSVTAARVLVAGLTNWLFNATGTNQNTPFVDYPARLNPGQTVEFVLQYFSSSRSPGPTPVLNAVGVPVPIIPPLAGTPVPGLQIQAREDGSALLQFPAIEGQRYAIRYASSPAFTNAWTIQPLVLAPGSWVQWLDQGPPATLSSPADAPVRFYRVHQIPGP